LTTKLLSEDLKSFCEATRIVGKKIHVSTLHRWADRGVRGRKLESIFIGGRRFTSLEAIERFLTPVAEVDSTNNSLRGPSQRRRAISEAEAVLADDGI
jgi:hypothetical protein